MKCEKLGVSVAFMSAMAFLLGWYSMTAALLIMLAVVCLSDNETMRKNVMSAFVFSLIFWLVKMVLKYVSGTYTGIVDNIYLFVLDRYLKWNIDYNAIQGAYKIVRSADICMWILKFIKFADFVLTVILTIVALKGKAMNVPLCTSLASKALGAISAKKKKDKKDKEESEETETKEAEQEQ